MKQRVGSLTALPKAHLHLHLAGSAPLSTIMGLAASAGVEITPPSRFKDLAEFMHNWNQVCSVIRTPENLVLILTNVIKREASLGVVHMEPSYNPIKFAKAFGVPPEELHQQMFQTAREAAKKAGISVGFMYGVDRNQPLDEIMAAAQFAASHTASGIVAFGYGGDEGHPKHTLEVLNGACSIARTAGLAIVPHAGEALGAEGVWDAIQTLKPNRIAHAWGAVASTQVLDSLARDKIACDISLASNMSLGLVPDAVSHPIRQLIAAGVPVTLNADDELFFNSSVVDEYETCRKELKLKDSQLAKLARNSIIYSQAATAVKEKALQDIDLWEGQLQVGQTSEIIS